jgi:hypothetical protein
MALSRCIYYAMTRSLELASGSHAKLDRKSCDTGLSRKPCDVIFGRKSCDFSILVSKEVNIKLFFK